MTGLRAASAGIIVGAILILSAQALSHVALDTAWFPVVGLSVAFGVLTAAAPFADSLRRPQENTLDDEGIRVGKRRLAWTEMRGYWIARSALGVPRLHIITMPGGLVWVELPSLPFAAQLESFLRVHLLELDQSERRLPPGVLPEQLALLSYVIILVGGASLGLGCIWLLRFVAPFTAVTGMAAGAGLLSVVVTIIGSRLYHLPRVASIGFFCGYLVGTFSVAELIFAALVTRAVRPGLL